MTQSLWWSGDTGKACESYPFWSVAPLCQSKSCKREHMCHGCSGKRTGIRQIHLEEILIWITSKIMTMCFMLLFKFPLKHLVFKKIKVCSGASFQNEGLEIGIVFVSWHFKGYPGLVSINIRRLHYYLAIANSPSTERARAAPEKC